MLYMVASLRHFGSLIGANSVSVMRQTLRIGGGPLSARDMMQRYAGPLPPANLRIRWSEGMPPHNVEVSPDSKNVPLFQSVVTLWDDPGTGTVRAATIWQRRRRKLNGQEQDEMVDPDPISPETLEPDATYIWSVIAINEFGSASSGEHEFATVRPQTPTPPPPDPHPPTPSSNGLSLRVSIASFGSMRSIKSVTMFVDGPSVPAGAIPFQVSQDQSTATAVMPLPSPPAGQASVSYTIRARSDFKYDGLINPNSGSISGPEDATVDLAPANILWTGQSLVALFSISYDGSNNVFKMTFDALFKA
jgi:hypothetical protein